MRNVEIIKPKYSKEVKLTVNVKDSYSEILDLLGDLIGEQVEYDRATRFTAVQGEVVIADFVARYDTSPDSPRETCCNLGQFIKRKSKWREDFAHPDERACKCCTDHDQLTVDSWSELDKKWKYLYAVEQYSEGNISKPYTNITRKDLKENNPRMIYAVADPEGLDKKGVLSCVQAMIEEFNEYASGDCYIIRNTDEEHWTSCFQGALSDILDEFVQNLKGE